MNTDKRRGPKPLVGLRVKRRHALQSQAWALLRDMQNLLDDLIADVGASVAVELRIDLKQCRERVASLLKEHETARAVKVDKTLQT